MIMKNLFNNRDDLAHFEQHVLSLEKDCGGGGRESNPPDEVRSSQPL